MFFSHLDILDILIIICAVVLVVLLIVCLLRRHRTSALPTPQVVRKEPFTTEASGKFNFVNQWFRAITGLTN